MSARGFAVACAVAALAGCSALLGIDGVSRDDSIGATDDGSAPTDAPSGDAGKDSTTPDGGKDSAANDAGGEGGVVALVKGFSAWGIALDDTDVYYTDLFGGQVGKVSKDGSTKSYLVDATSTTMLFHVQGLAIDATDVYFNDASGVYRCAKAGCMNSPKKLVDLTAYGPPFELDVDSTSVYFTYTGTSADGGMGDGVYKLDKTTGANFKQLAAVTAPNGLQVVGGRVYVALDDGSIVSVDATTGATSTLSPPASPGPAELLTVDKGSIFWTNLADPGQVLTMPASGMDSGSASFALLQHVPFGISVDSNWVYWTDIVIPTATPGKGVVNRCARTDCSMLATIATGYSLLRKVVNDANAVYWTDQGDTTPMTGGVFKWVKQ